MRFRIGLAQNGLVLEMCQTAMLIVSVVSCSGVSSAKWSVCCRTDQVAERLFFADDFMCLDFRERLECEVLGAWVLKQLVTRHSMS